MWHIITMKFEEALKKIGNEPVFGSDLLAVYYSSDSELSRQIARWIRSGYLLQLRRGLYALAENYRKKTPHPFYIANNLKKASYVSLHSALAHHGLIPEHVPVITSVTTGRPEKRTTPLGSFVFKHIKTDLFFGYEVMDVGHGQNVFIAEPEKAMLDLAYLTPGSDDAGYIRGLRLQNVTAFRKEHLINFADRSGSQKLIRVVRIFESLRSELEKP
jgi:predicted transcriptional regulator of viral defense system